MHIGNLRSALYAYLIAKSKNGKFILRIEDTDQARYIPGAENVIYNTLKISGLNFDEGPNIGGSFGPYIQSQRIEIYNKYAQKMIENNKAYYCFCPKKIHTDSNITHDFKCNCRNLPQAEIDLKLNNKTHVIRQKMPISGETKFVDEVFGEIIIQNIELEDQILVKSDKFPTYNFANVIDDHEMQISHIIRGSEYLSSTPKYNLIYEAFGWNIPKYIHLPLILGKNDDGTTSKLSKRNGSISFEDLINDGFLPEAVINYISLLGWSPKDNREIFSLKELEREFKIERIGKSAAVFDYSKLLWMNSEYIRSKSTEEFSEIISNFVDNKKYNVIIIAKILQSRISRLSEILPKISFLFDLPEFDVSLFFNKKSKTNETNVPEIIKNIINKFEKLNKKDWDHENIYSNFLRISELINIKSNAIMWTARISVTGMAVTPGGAVEIFEILGKNEVLRRLKISSHKF
ncbi:MAG: glutamate--tRNA ligase [Candidatus Improbicoccus devescovinae]|nr:MAG: glutamate--tRNA ligase [Candidatus Improbicoccus devescovinae]